MEKLLTTIQLAERRQLTLLTKTQSYLCNGVTLVTKVRLNPSGRIHAFCVLICCLVFARLAPVSASEASKAEANARRLLASGRVEDAEKIIWKELLKRPTDPVLLVLMGRVNKNRPFRPFKKAENDRSKEYFYRAVKADPEYAPGHFQLAYNYLIEQNFNEALIHANAAVNCKKKNYESYKVRAIVLSNLNQHDKALVDFDTYLKNYPTTTGDLVMKAQMLERAKRYSQAALVYEDLVKGKYSDMLFFKLASCYELAGDLERSVKAYSKIISIKPDDDLALLKRARLYTRQKDYKRALADYTKAISLMPSPTAYKERAVVNEKLGNTTGANDDIRKSAECW